MNGDYFTDPFDLGASFAPAPTLTIHVADVTARLTPRPSDRSEADQDHLDYLFDGDWHARDAGQCGCIDRRFMWRELARDAGGTLWH